MRLLRHLKCERKVLKDTIPQLEEGEASLAFATGMAAETTVMHPLDTGDHAICGHDVYGETYRLFQDVMRASGLEFTFLTPDDRRGKDYREKTGISDE